MRFKYVTWCTLIFLKLIHFDSYKVDGSLQDDIARQLATRNATNLSRSRRYLVFPEGSSFQLVFDLAYPTLDGIGLYVFGNTAAMAWELPSTPVFLDKKYHRKEEPEPTTTELPPLEHFVEYDDHHEWQPPLSWDETHRIDFQKPNLGWKNGGFPTNSAKHQSVNRTPVRSYSNPFQKYIKNGFNPTPGSTAHPVQYISPYSSTRGYSHSNNPSSFWNRWDRKGMQNKRKRFPLEPATLQSFESRNVQFDQNLHRNIHRRTRRELYAKIEELLSALISDGKTCLLKIICQVNKIPKGKGTLFEELLKTLFKVKPDDFSDDDEDHYDAAANSSHNCDTQYPDCEGNVLSRLLKTVTKNKIYQ